MPLFTYQDLKNYPSQSNFSNALDHGIIKTASSSATFDIFLSHSYKNKDLALEIKEKFRTYDFSVYIDWIEDPELDRKNVNKNTANRLRHRIQQCKSLAFLDTPEALESKWTPWEVGFADANKQRVFIIPKKKKKISYRDYKGQEFFSLYPFLDEEPNNKDHRLTLWINSPYKKEHYDTLIRWLEKGEPFTDHSNH